MLFCVEILNAHVNKFTFLINIECLFGGWGTSLKIKKKNNGLNRILESLHFNESKD